MAGGAPLRPAIGRGTEPASAGGRLLFADQGEATSLNGRGHVHVSLLEEIRGVCEELQDSCCFWLWLELRGQGSTVATICTAGARRNPNTLPVTTTSKKSLMRTRPSRRAAP